MLLLLVLLDLLDFAFDRLDFDFLVVDEDGLRSFRPLREEFEGMVRVGCVYLG